MSKINIIPTCYDNGELRAPVRSVLLITFYYSPCTLFPTSSFRVERLARGFVQNGFSVKVVTLDPLTSTCPCAGCTQARKTGSVPAGVPPSLVIHRLSPPSYGNLAEGNAREYAYRLRGLEKARLRLTKLLFFLLNLPFRSRAPWRLLEPLETGYRFGDAVLAQVEEGGLTPPDLLLTSSGPYATLFLGALLKRRWQVPWVADLRDSLSGHFYRHGRLHRLSFSLLKPMLIHALQEADELTTVSPEEARRDERLLRRLPLAIPPGWDPEEWEKVLPQEELQKEKRWKFLYAGRLYPGYITLAPFLSGWKLFLERHPQEESLLYYYGPSAALLEEELAPFPELKRRTILHPPVPPEEIRRIMRSVDLLILPTSSYGEGGVGGGKLFEYIGARVPILSYPCDPYVERILEETGLGVATSAEPEAIARTLERLRERRGEPPSPPGEDALRRYTYTELVKPLCARFSAGGS